MERIDLVVDGVRESAAVDDRTTLADCLRDSIGRTSVHLGCEHGVCGACTVLVDEVPVRACLMLAIQARGKQVTTVTGLERLDPARTAALQRAFRTSHAMQCGFCTPGMLLVARTLIAEAGQPDEASVRDAIHGNLCRCTGYQQIIEAVLDAAAGLSSLHEKAGESGLEPADGLAQQAVVAGTAQETR